MDDLECSALEKALKEQVYRLAGQWEQGTPAIAVQSSTEHYQPVFQPVQPVL